MTRKSNGQMRMANGQTVKVTREPMVPSQTWASKVETRRVSPRPRLSREELAERELYGSVVRFGFEPKRAYR